MPNTTLKVNAAAVDPGNTEYGRATVTRSNGVVYAASYNSDAKIHIYEISADRLTVTDRIAITPSSSEIPKRICLALFQSDNSIAVAYQSDDVYNHYTMNIRYCKVNSTTWAAPTWENVAGTSGASTNYQDFDMDVSDTGMPVVACITQSSISSLMSIYARGTTGGTWVQSSYTPTLIGSGNGPVKTGSCISVQALGTVSSQRDVVIACGATGNNPKTDLGVGIYTARFTETTAALIAGSGAKKTTIMTATIKNADIANTTPNLDKKMRHVKVYRTNNAATFDVAGMSSSTKTTHYMRGSISNGTYTLLVPEASAAWTSKSWASMGITYGVASSGAGIPQMPTWYVKDTAGVVWQKAGRLNADNISVVFRGGDGRAYGGLSTQTVSTLSDNAAPFPSVTDQDSVITVNDSVSGAVTIYDNYAGFAPGMPGGGSGITALSPATGAVNLTAHPSLNATVDTDQKFGTGPYVVDFQFASDAGFTTSVQDQIEPFAAAVNIDGTDTPGVTISYGDSTEFALAKQVWYYRARLVDMWGIVSGWFSGGSFTVGHPPAAVPKSPLSGGYYIWNGGIINCSWDFTDPSPGDTQSAYQVQVIDVLTGTVIQDTGKVTSTVQNYTTTALTGYQDAQIKWQVRLWDSTDTVGAYSAPQQFVMTTPPAVSITSPTSGATATTGTPSYIFGVTTGGGRTITGYQVLVTSGAGITYAGPLVAVSVASGGSITAKMPPNYLQNNLGYSVQITIVDSAGMVAVSPVIPFTTAWTPPTTPGAVTVDASNYDTETLGYVQVSWPDTGRMTGFTHWTVYRKDDLIDPNSGTVIQAGTFQPIFQDYDTGTLYVYNDYVAPSNQYKSTYAVTQWINSAGQDMESLMSSAAPVTPTSAAYWLINQNTDVNTADTVRLTIVTDDSYTEEQEEAEFTIIGRGRVVNRGQYLGPKGSLTARLRNTGSTTARQKRQNLLTIQQESGTLLMRNPFGDIWEINMSNMQVDRIAGVGTAEFCDVTLPYAEVS